MTKRLFCNLSVILLASVSAFAQQPIKVQIPFSFHVGQSILPAGEYTADSNVAQGILRLRSGDYKSNVMIMSNHVQSNTTSDASKLVFHKYADQYFLYQVWTAGSNSGRELRQSKPEMRLAANGRRGIQAVLAQR